MTDPGGRAPDLQAAMEQHRRGALADARRLYREHLETRPGDVEALCLLGALEGQDGHHADAESAYRQAIETDAGYGPAHGGLGTSLLHQDRPEEAAQALAEAVRLAPEQPEMRLQLTVALQRSGRPGQAAMVLQDFVERWPEHLQARHNLGLLLLQADQPDAAMAEFRQVLDRDPARVESWIGLGRASTAANDPAAAEAAFDRAAELAPDAAEPKVLKGRALLAQGRNDEAKQAFSAALSDQPGHGAAVVGLADLDLRTGRPERGLDRLAPLLERPRPAPGVLRTAARLMVAAGRGEEAVRRIDDWLGAVELPAPARAGLLSVRGRALDDLGETEAAWRSWSESHAQRPSRFDGAHFDFAVDQLIAAFGPALFERAAAPRPAGRPRPLLLVGAPRSGKSLLEQMLACHPGIRGGGELRLLGAMTQEIAARVGSREDPYPRCVGDLGERDLAALAEAYCRGLEARAEGAAWLVDTQPTNFLHLGLAALVSPDLPVVFCHRDPLDTAWACFRTHFADPGLDFVSSPEGIARYLAGMSRLMRHWAAAAPVRVIDVRYEDLVRSPRATLETVLGHLGLDWDQAMTEYATPGRADLAAAPVTDRPLDDTEIGRGAPYRDRFADVIRVLAETDHAG